MHVGTRSCPVTDLLDPSLPERATRELSISGPRVPAETGKGTWFRPRNGLSLQENGGELNRGRTAGVLGSCVTATCRWNERRCGAHPDHTATHEAGLAVVAGAVGLAYHRAFACVRRSRVRWSRFTVLCTLRTPSQNSCLPQTTPSDHSPSRWPARSLRIGLSWALHVNGTRNTGPPVSASVLSV